MVGGDRGEEYVGGVVDMNRCDCIICGSILRSAWKFERRVLRGYLNGS